MTNALDVNNVTVQIGESRLLNDVSIEIEAGRIVALVGANGAGKTTLLDAITGEIDVTRGSVSVGGKKVQRRAGTAPPEFVGRVFQGSPLPETMTVAEITMLATTDRRAADALMDRFGLRVHATTFVVELSTGMRRILDLAVAASNDPVLLLLDEPSSGLAPSEVEKMAEHLERWRSSTGGSILIVEHDTGLVRRLADDVIVLNAGEVIGEGSPDEMLIGHAVAKTRVANPTDSHFKEVLRRVAQGAEPAAPPVRRTLSTWTLLRLGLREFAVGMSSVLILGVLNRVMKVELGVSLLAVGIILSSYNLAAPLALPIGHLSDTRPIFGRKRGPYIVGGATIAGLAVVLAPYVADMLGNGVNFVSVGLGVLLFVVMGVGMYGAGPVFFALLADMVPQQERGHAASLVYFELMAGIFAGVALTGAVVGDDASGLKTLFALVGFLVVALTVLAVWGQEAAAIKRGLQEPEPASQIKFRDSVSSIVKMSQVRLFFGFMVLATLFIFLQQAVLEPYGGEVLGMNVRQTSAFHGMMTAGVLVGMGLGGRPWAQRLGYLKLARYGLYGGIVTFALLAAAAVSASTPPSWIATFGIGLATGLFNVATLALMMSMADAKRTALFMATWTMAHALADGSAVAGGGIVFEIMHKVLGSVPGGYASVFAIEAVGLVICLPILSKIDVTKFRAEIAGYPVDEPADVKAGELVGAISTGRTVESKTE